ncbi:MAG: T9SS type A sorting domain-containing protein [Taibaiella sp.]|nr:T9SS type A sorting domain-containing protein [Taibaiella sp.]
MKKPLFPLIAIICLSLSASAQPWTLIPNDLVMTYLGSVSIGDAHTVYVTGNNAWADSSSFLKSTDGGLSFHHISTSFLPPGHTAHTVSFLNADTGYVVSYSTYGSSPTSDGTIHRTTDGGLSWTTVISGITQMIVKLKFADANTGYAVATNNAGNPYSIYRTINGGVSWSWWYTAPSNMEFSDLILVDANTAFILGNNDTGDATITRISGGAISTTSTFPSYSYFKLGHFSSASEGTVIAVIGGSAPAQHILKTSDGGVSWTTSYMTDFVSLNAIGIDNDGSGFIVGGRNFSTPDKGASWSPLNDTAFYGYGVHYDIAIRDGLRIIVGQSGGIWRQVSTTSVAESKIDIIADIFPNPISHSAEIEFGKTLTRGTIKLYDMTGRLIHSAAVDGNRATLNAANLAPGIYTLQVTADECNMTKNIVVR